MISFTYIRPPRRPRRRRSHYLEELIQRANVLARQQESGVILRHASAEQRAEVRGALQGKLLKYLAGVGRVAAKENIELGAQFHLPHAHSSNQGFLTMAQRMLETATAQKDLLVGRGMSETLLDDLAAAIAAFEQTLEATRASRRDHVGASADLRAVASEIAEQVGLLDGLVRYRFGHNAELMGAWERARDVLGPFKPHAKPEPAGDGGEAGSQEPAVVAPGA